MRIFRFAGYGFLCFCFLHCNVSRRALKAVSNRDYVKAASLLEGVASPSEVWQSDSMAWQALSYAYACLYGSEDYVRFDIDTAYFFIHQSLRLFDEMEEKKQKASKRDFLESKRIYIDSLGFRRACADSVLSKEEYLASITHFVQQHTRPSVWRSLARVKRDSVAFAWAKEAHTLEAYENFMYAYSHSAQMDEVRDLYASLRYEYAQREDSIASWEAFLEEFPQSEQRVEIERRLLDLYSLRATASAFGRFIQWHPRSIWRSWAEKLQRAVGSMGIFRALAPKERIFPIYSIDSGAYQWVDGHGQRQSFVHFDTLAGSYICEGLPRHQWWLVAGRADTLGVYDSQGKRLLDTVPDGAVSLGDDLLLLKARGRYILWLRGDSVPIFDLAYDTLSWLSSGFFHTRDSLGREGLLSLTGRKMNEAGYEAVEEIGKWLILKKEGVYYVSDSEQKGGRRSQRKEYGPFEEMEVLENEYLVVKTFEKGYCLLNKEMSLLLEDLDYPPVLAGAYWVLSDKEGRHYLWGESQKGRKGPYGAFYYNTSWVLVRDTTAYIAWSAKGEAFVYDTAYVLNNHVLVGEKEGVFSMHFDQETTRTYPRTHPKDRLEAIGTPSGLASYYIFHEGSQRWLFSSQGERLCALSYKVKRLIAEGIFEVEERTRFQKGLMDAGCNVVVPMIHSAFRKEKGEKHIILWSEEHFGVWDMSSRVYVSADYDSYPQRFGSWGWLVQHKGRYGVLDSRRRTRIPFRYEALRYWNETMYLGKGKEGRWQAYGYDSHRPRGEIGFFSQLFPLAGIQDAYRVKTAEGWGILQAKGLTIPAIYHEIVPIGPQGEKPYFLRATRYAKDAELYIVIYYSLQAEKLFSSAYDTHTYEKLFCRNH